MKLASEEMACMQQENSAKMQYRLEAKMKEVNFLTAFLTRIRHAFFKALGPSLNGRTVNVAG